MEYCPQVFKFVHNAFGKGARWLKRQFIHRFVRYSILWVDHIAYFAQRYSKYDKNTLINDKTMKCTSIFFSLLVIATFVVAQPTMILLN